VDYGEWDPAIDPNIAAHYSGDKLSGKRECRRDLLHAFGLEGVGEDTAVIGVVSRFSTQKGFDFIVEIMDRLIQEDVVVVMLGSGEEYYERVLTEMASRYRSKLRVQTAPDDVMAHKVKAGSDILLVPSRYEPGGLSQIYGLRYGTVPVVRATGALDDTIDEQPLGGGNGFKFSGYSSAALMDALNRALSSFRNKEEWSRVMQRGMAQDFSWDLPAKEYLRVYERTIENRS
jgi:starch synthase